MLLQEFTNNMRRYEKSTPYHLKILRVTIISECEIARVTSGDVSCGQNKGSALRSFLPQPETTQYILTHRHINATNVG
jgi:hypothetical protein